ncbi:MAG: DUF1893 domain-containing protein [Elusimicrobiota bacterium]|jgi:hypothetical protein|nr:DUF1893 domain-containing protein [Elusimicrobiota bacterium]
MLNIKNKGLELLKSGEASCIVIKDEKIIHTANGKGVKPLKDLLEDNPDFMRGTFVIDEIIGKAAAILLVLGHVKKVYGDMISDSAYNYLIQKGVEVEYNKRVKNICNKSGDDICPLEKSVLEIDDPKVAFEAIKKTIKELMTAV